MKKIYLSLMGLTLLLLSGILNSSAQTTTTLLTQDFSSASGTTPPTGWTNNVLVGSYTWFFNNPNGRSTSSPISGQFGIFDSDYLGSGAGLENAAIESPTINTTGYNVVFVKWDQYFAGVYNSYDSIAVEVYNGSTWNAVFVDKSTAYPGGASSKDINISAFAANNANVKVRFRYVGDWSWWWIVDNIEVYAVTSPIITAQPAGVSLCAGGNTSFSVTASNVNAYQWQESTDGGTVWTNISNGGVYSGATTSTLSLTNVTTSFANYKYRCYVSGTVSPAATSNAATLTMLTAYIATTTTGHACPGAASGQVNATALPAGATVSWYDAASGGTFLGTGNSLNITSPTATTTYYAQASASATSGTLTTIIPGTNSQLGAMLDIKPLVNMTLTGFDFVPVSTGTYTVSVYYKVGTLVGSETNSSAWTLLQTATNISTTANTPYTITFSSPPALTANQVYGFYVVRTGSSNSIRYHTTSSFGALYSSNSELEAYQGKGTSGLFGGSMFSPRTLSGKFRYTTSPPCPNLTTRTGVVLSVDTLPAITSQPAASATICENSSTSFSITATGTNVVYQWQVSTNGGGTWTNLTNVAPYSNVTTATLNITAAPASINTYQYRCIVSGNCPPNITSNTAILNVNALPAITTNPPSTTTACAGNNASITVVATGAAISYQWQLSTNGGSTWANMSNSATYNNVTSATLDILSANTTLNNNQYRCYISGTCSPAVTSAASTFAVSILPAISANPQASTTICETNNASFSVTATGTGITYQWQLSTNGGSIWTNLVNGAPYSNVTTSTMNITSATTGLSGNQYRCVVTGSCSPTAVSTVAALTVQQLPFISADPVSIPTCPAGNASFSITAGGTGITYQWQLSTNGGSTWTNLTNTAPYSNVNTATINITGATLSMNNYQYRCVVSGACSTTVTSNIATLTVNSTITINNQPPVSQVVCTGSNITIPVNVTGASTFQWYGDFGSGFVALSNNAIYSGVNTATLSITNASASVTGTYRCIVGSPCTAPFATNTSSLVVHAPVSINTQPVSANNCVGSNSYFTVAATGGGTLMYSWQVSTNGGSTWANVSSSAPYNGVTTNQLTIANTSFSLNNYQYRCEVTSGCLVPVLSNAATLTVTQAIVINTQPVALQSVCAGTAASISVVASNATTYQWQRDNGSGYVNLTNSAPYSGVTTATLSVSPASAATNGSYRCLIGNGICANVTTNASVLNIYPATTITTQPVSVTTCQGVSSYFSVAAAGGGILSYRWQVSTNGGSTWSNLNNTAPYSGVTSIQLTITNTPIGLNNYQYRCVVSGICGTSVVSSSAILTINTPPTVSNPVAVTTCLGTNASYTVTGGGTSISYRWQESTNGGTAWANLNNGGVYSNVTTATLNLTGVTASMNGRWYRCIVTGICPTSPAISNGVMLTVTMPPSVTVQPTDQTICLGNSTSYSVSATGTGPLSYQWQEDQGGGFTNLSNGSNFNGVTTTTLNVNNPALLSNGYSYRCYVSGACSPATVSSPAMLMVNDTVTLGSIGFTDTLCTGDSSIFSVTIGGPVTSIRWQVDMGSGFTDIPLFTPPYIGADAATLKIAPANNNQYGYLYRCVVSGTCNTLVSNIFGTITYKVPEITTDPVDAKVPQGQDATFQATASDTGYLYYWQGSSDGGNNWSNIYNNNMYSGTLTPMLTVLKVNPAQEGWMFRCIILDPKGYCYVDHDTSNAAKLSVALMPPFPVNVSNVKEQVRLTVYPNPVQGSELMVRVEGTERKTMNYRIIDEFGRTVQRSAVELDRTHTGRMDVNILVPAVYTIQFTDEQNNVLQSVRFTRVQ